ncbi:MAG: GGDEF domain-containing protein [Candidatus Competibacteraceae bacterium]
MDISDRKRLEEKLRQLAITDPLTGAFNRRYLLQMMETEISRAQRYSRPLTLIMFDIDHFKRINDTFGHEQGDAVLKGIAALVRERLRHSDIFVRWGGEEFMILTTETALSKAIELTETLRVALHRCSSRHRAGYGQFWRSRIPFGRNSGSVAETGGRFGVPGQTARPRPHQL